MRTAYRQSGNSLHIPDELWKSPFLAACRGEATPHTPVWLMRQAGRYMKEYRAVRAEKTFLELCHDSALAAEVTVYAQQRLGVDAAIIFADILLILAGLGMDLTYAKGDGPKLHGPIRSGAQVQALGNPEQAAADCRYVAEAVRITRRDLPANIPLIGFCGAPFTLASYAIEGGGSRQFAATRSFMYNHSQAWHELAERLVAALVPYCHDQVQAGAQALQIFDSWAGALPRADYEEFVLPHLSTLVQAMPIGVPVIVFGTNTGHLLPCFKAAGADVVGIDSTTDLLPAWNALGGPETLSVQGNSDPGLLLAPPERAAAQVEALLREVGDRPGHIFNLGHGVFKETNVDHAIHMVQTVQRVSAQIRSGS